MTRPAAELSAIDKIASPDADLISRFAQDLYAIWPEGQANQELRLGLAVSGGPDSLALLLLANAALPGRVDAATVDHGLRAESAHEAQFVAQICAELQVCHAVLSVSVADGNVQAQARDARYQALGKWLSEGGLSALATAHHADDQAETLLMRLNRASGVAGLAGVRARGKLPGVEHLILRPVLAWRRSTLGEVVTAAHITAVDDPSNSNDRFDRVRLRKALAEADWIDASALAASAAHLADADAAIEWAAAREWAESVTEEGLGLLYRPRAPRAIVLRVLSRIVAKLDGEEPRGSAIAKLFDTLRAGGVSSIGNLVARATHAGWSFTAAPKRRS